MAPRRTGSRLVCRFPFIEIHEHDVEHEGGPPQQVVTLSFPDWVAVAAADEEGRFLLVEQFRHGIEGPTLEPAGGLVDPGEAPEDAARRELLEETGHECARLAPLGWVHPNPALSSNRCHFFLATGAKRVQEPMDDAHERVCVRRVSSPELEALLDGGRVSHALAVVCLTRALRWDARSRVLALIDEVIRGQHDKVVALARRLRPDLTLEDLQSPHDFPELGDVDWHFEDGQLAGIKAVRYAVMGMSTGADDGEEAEED
jgi:ADP-ribose pyrophosphatase